MAYLSQFPTAENVLEVVPVASSGTGGWRLTARIWSMAKWIGDNIETMADYYAAATLYEGLSKLSDGELQRRGLSRHTLARDVFERRGLI
jgi:hypothetical protein